MTAGPSSDISFFENDVSSEYNIGGFTRFRNLFFFASIYYFANSKVVATTRAAGVVSFFV